MLFYRGLCVTDFDATDAARRWESYMRRGEFEKAWRESDAIAAAGMAGPANLWGGTPFDGKRVIVRCLHGFGDAIQFLRYASLVRQTASRLMIETHPEMVALLRTLPAADDVITWAEPHHIGRSDWDQQVEVMELPWIFRTTIGTIPRVVPYLGVTRRGVPRLPPTQGPRIGLLWASSAWNPLRSLAFDDLLPLIDLPGFSVFSFQRGPEREQMHGPAFDTSLGAPDILDTARDLLEIDLLITVDTMAAHLAGALGVPVWTLLPQDADWRWMLNRDDSPWYPTMRLFRRTERDKGWFGVIHRVRQALLDRFGVSATLEPRLHSRGYMSETNNPKELAVVTGASSGIGLELAKEFARRGFDLVIGAESAGIEKAAAEIRALGANVQAIQVDLRTFDGVEKFYAQINRPIDVIAINAGVGVGGDFVRETDLQAELDLINLNVVSTVHLAKLVLKDMVARNKGRVLFTASVVSIAPGPLEAVYGASKAFVFSFAEALRAELKETEVTITALMPGATETNFFHRAGMDGTKIGQAKKDDPAQVAREGIEALFSDKDRVVAGSLKNKVLTTVGSVSPEAAAELHRKQAEPVHSGD
jgi:short-subunit dehydrogenase